MGSLSELTTEDFKDQDTTVFHLKEEYDILLPLLENIRKTYINTNFLLVFNNREDHIKTRLTGTLYKRKTKVSKS